MLERKPCFDCPDRRLLRRPGPAGTAAARVSRLVVPGGSTFEVAYDGNQTRHAVVEDGVSTYFLWDGLRLLETRNADYSLKCRFTHVAPPASGMVDGIGTCVEACRASDGKRFYMLYDHRGSAYAVLDESKTVIATRLYSAFGELVSESGTWPSEVPFGYQSNWIYLCDLADGSPLYLTRTRPYHARLGRFLQRDLRRTPGENLYVYARNNPVNLVDAMGLDPEKCPEDMTNEELVKESKRLREEIKKNPGSDTAKDAARRLVKINKEARKRIGAPAGPDVSIEEMIEAVELHDAVEANEKAIKETLPGEPIPPVGPDPPPEPPLEMIKKVRIQRPGLPKEKHRDRDRWAGEKEAWERAMAAHRRGPDSTETTMALYDYWKRYVGSWQEPNFAKWVAGATERWSSIDIDMDRTRRETLASLWQQARFELEQAHPEILAKERTVEYGEMGELGHRYQWAGLVGVVAQLALPAVAPFLWKAAPVVVPAVVKGAKAVAKKAAPFTPWIVATGHGIAEGIQPGPYTPPGIDFPGYDVFHGIGWNIGYWGGELYERMRRR